MDLILKLMEGGFLIGKNGTLEGKFISYRHIDHVKFKDGVVVVSHNEEETKFFSDDADVSDEEFATIMCAIIKGINAQDQPSKKKWHDIMRDAFFTCVGYGLGLCAMIFVSAAILKSDLFASFCMGFLP